MEVHVARQPIFDTEKKVIGYELLFRNGEDDFFPGMDADQATADVINSSFFLKVVDDLTGGKKAFINFSPRFLKHEMMTMLPPQSLALELSENGEVDATVLAACKSLKEQGYMVVLDDFVLRQQAGVLLQAADMVKVDFLKTQDAERRDIARKLAGTQVALLAEKIETYYDFKQAKEIGYRFFQGYFFGRPEVFSGRDIPGYTVNYLNMLREASRIDIDFDKLEQIFRRDVALSFKMLKFINSAFFGLRNKVSSVKQALVLLGRKEILKWISLLALQNMAQDKPDELVVLSRMPSLMAMLFCWLSSSAGPKKATRHFWWDCSRWWMQCWIDRWSISSVNYRWTTISPRPCCGETMTWAGCTRWRGIMRRPNGTIFPRRQNCWALPTRMCQNFIDSR